MNLNMSSDRQQRVEVQVRTFFDGERIRLLLGTLLNGQQSRGFARDTFQLLIIQRTDLDVGIFLHCLVLCFGRIAFERDERESELLRRRQSRTNERMMFSRPAHVSMQYFPPLIIKDERRLRRKCVDHDAEREEGEKGRM